ncbi:biotin/lipoyl-containing protein [Micromonospora sp. NPDC050397]|uniref:biotin/lipoyl-containing protein n=1 Tax=Micromonospora sp. NPDC050397 TaxID=3364279 RepID=UPI00384F17DB
MLDAIALTLVVALAAAIAFGDPIRLRRPRRPATWSRAARRWWPYPLLLFWTVDAIAHRHLGQRTVLAALGLLGVATAVSLVRGTRQRPAAGSSVREVEPAVPYPIVTGSAEGGTTVPVVMPWLGDGVTTATVTAVLKLPGQSVRAGEAVCEVSTDKVDTEVPSEVSGVVAAVLVRPPSRLAVGEPILTVAPHPTS